MLKMRKAECNMKILPIIVGAVIAAIIPHYYLYKRYHYICSGCSKAFKPNSFFISMFALNGGNYRRVRCTHCHCKAWAKLEKDSIENS